jgi:hypothetical protein
MILLQNPDINVPQNPIEIDAAIVDINNELNSRLSWISNAYGRIYKNLDVQNGQSLFFPEHYLGNQNNSFRYLNVTPDNDKTGQCFFFVRRETITEFQTGQFGFLNYDVSIIFSVNMKLVSDLVNTDIYQNNLIAEVRNVLTRQLLGKTYKLTIQSIDYIFEDVFSDFNIQNQEQVEKSPLTHFKVNCQIVLPEACPVPEIVPSIACKSLDFDGVNEYIANGIYPSPDTGNSNFLVANNQKFSLSVWFKLNSYSFTQMPVFGMGNSSVQLGYFITVLSSTGRIRFNIVSGIFTTVTGQFFVDSFDNISLNEWVNVICTYDGSQNINGAKIYINGVDNGATRTVTGTGLSNDITYPTTPLKVFRGRSTGTSEGQVFNCRMWRGVELNSSQALAEYNNGFPSINAVLKDDLVLNLDIQNANFDGSFYKIENLTGLTPDFTVYNSEQIDLIDDCPE